MATVYEVMPTNAALTIKGTGVQLRTAPVTGISLKALNKDVAVQAVARALVNGEPWFAVNGGWVSGNFVQGWVKDNNDNNCWWYVEKGYSYPKRMWKKMNGKDYCFGPDGYLFVKCYIKSEVNNTYYWVNDDGVYLSQFDTTKPDRSYRVVENFKTENAYRGNALPVTYSGNVRLSDNQMKVNAQYILNYLRAKGWTKNAICGVLGNMQIESTVNPGRWRVLGNGNSENNMDNGFGLVQWTPAKRYFDWTQKNDLPAVYMDSELQRLLYEVKTPGEQYIPTSDYNLTFSEFIKSIKSAYYLACAFSRNYERPADPNQCDTRGKKAEEWFNSLT